MEQFKRPEVPPETMAQKAKAYGRTGVRLTHVTITALIIILSVVEVAARGFR